MKPLHSLLRSHLLDVLSSEAEFWRSWRALDQRQFDSLLNATWLVCSRNLSTRRGMSAPKNLAGYFPELSALAGGKRFDLTHAVFRQMQRRFQSSNVPAFQLSSSERQAEEQILKQRPVEKRKWQDAYRSR